MRHVGGRRDPRLLVAVGLIAVSIAAIAQASSAATEQGRSVRIAIFTDCKGAFAFGYELDIGGANAAFSQFAGARPKNKNKPSAGLIGGQVRAAQS